MLEYITFLQDYPYVSQYIRNWNINKNVNITFLAYINFTLLMTLAAGVKSTKSGDF
jgi:hypothetical protein